jgi:hypothetical protein
VTEFKTLLSFSDNHKHLIEGIDFENDIGIGAKARLETLGLLKASYSGTSWVGIAPVIKTLEITQFGINFVLFCLE